MATYRPMERFQLHQQINHDSTEKFEMAYKTKKMFVYSRKISGFSEQWHAPVYNDGVHVQDQATYKLTSSRGSYITELTTSLLSVTKDSSMECLLAISVGSHRAHGADAPMPTTNDPKTRSADDSADSNHPQRNRFIKHRIRQVFKLCKIAQQYFMYQLASA